MKSSVFTAVLVTLSSAALAQQSFTIEQHIQKIISVGDEVENSAYYDLMLFYYDNPIDLNRGLKDEFAQFAFLTKEEIMAIIAHREISGPYQSIYELQAIPALTMEKIELLLPFVTVVEQQSLPQKFADAFKSNKNYLAGSYSRVVQHSRGFNENIYAGSPDRAQIRLRIRNPGKLSIGLSAQKDPGELWLSTNKVKTPDHLSGHLYIENHKRINQLVIGDYRMQYGQGLLLGAGFMAGKNVETVLAVKQPSVGILPFSSVSETHYLKGVGTNLRITDMLSVSLFYSNQQLDATPTVFNFKPAVSAIRSSGLHRTATEIASANLLNEQIWGSAAVFRTKQLTTGMVLMTTQYDMPIIPSPTDYNQYLFSGKALTNYSWFGQYSVKNILFFGEVAKTQGAGMAVSTGLIASLSRTISLSLHYRNFAKNFHSMYGQSFSERDRLNNEEGFYWGIKIAPSSKMLISAYYDMYMFPWISSTTAAPAMGNDYLLRFAYNFSKSNSAFIQLRNEQFQEKEAAGVAAINRNTKLLKSIVNFDFAQQSDLSYRTRIQFNRHGTDNENSWLLLQDITYSRLKFGFTARILMFDVPSVNTRQYVYEKDMLFSYITRSYLGKGMSYYAIIKYKPYNKMSLRFKWSLTEYLNQHTMGSGYDEIAGNIRTQLTAQLNISF